MRENSAIGWLVGGAVIAAIDAWLSVQSMIGLMGPTNPISWTAVAVVGVLLTGLAVVTPLVVEQGRHPGVKAGWVVITVGDIATSVIGAIWYGVMGHALSESVDFARLSFQPRNALSTVLYAAFVAALFYGCLQLGRSLGFFRAKRNGRP